MEFGGKEQIWGSCLRYYAYKESRAVAQKPRDAVVKFHTYRNLQRHRAVLPLIARILLESTIIIIHRPTFCSQQHKSTFVEIVLLGSGIFAYFGGFGRSRSCKVTDIGANRKPYVTSY